MPEFNQKIDERNILNNPSKISGNFSEKLDIFLKNSGNSERKLDRFSEEFPEFLGQNWREDRERLNNLSKFPGNFRRNWIFFLNSGKLERKIGPISWESSRVFRERLPEFPAILPEFSQIFARIWGGRCPPGPPAWYAYVYMYI